MRIYNTEFDFCHIFKRVQAKWNGEDTLIEEPKKKVPRKVFCFTSRVKKIQECRRNNCLKSYKIL